MFTKEKYRCLTHIINLTTQSKAKYYDPHNINDHTLDINAMERDELRPVHAISVKASKEIFLEYMVDNIVLGIFFIAV